MTRMASLQYFNDERKKAYLDIRNNRGVVKNLFNTSYEYEDRFNEDLCELPVAVIQTIFDERFGIDVTENMRLSSELHSYISWCNKNMYAYNQELLSFVPNLNKKYRTMTIESPMHLKRILDDYYDCINQRYSCDEIDRAFIWMIYSGIELRDSINVLTKDVDYDSRAIFLKGKEYELPEESIGDFVRAANVRKVLKERQGLDIEDINDVFLMGGKIGKYDINASSHRLAKKLDSAPVYATHTKCTLKTIYSSGVFYRNYLFDKIGHKPPFKINTDKALSENGMKTAQSTLKKNYYQWKKAFGL